MTPEQLTHLVKTNHRVGLGRLADLRGLRVARRYCGPGTPHEVLRCDRTGRRVLNVTERVR